MPEGQEKRLPLSFQEGQSVYKEPHSRVFYCIKMMIRLLYYTNVKQRKEN